ncbi:S1/P1 nuclease [Ulvibacter antarcticus]|uniref:S1/P1 nuclease n=1 Tax=Ulvibacter antarcticus TaxID=442714 RepID=A0A3L9YVH0_9FLAO|nr:S1/P1 nuclease [Ulvibacter antarcticus]RMA58472.1 S1/P1 nuclease [Ulvibacter antarcticus]
MKNYISLLFLIVFSAQTLTATNDWGKTGHRVTGEIAQNYLSKKAQKKISKLLNGASLAFVSNYGDDIKSDDAYRSYSPWHYVNFPFDSTYEAHPKSEKGDLIAGINTCIEVLKNETSSNQEKVFHLKMLVHFIGDLHQPLHIGLAEDKGGNDFQVRWFNDGTNLHTVWDTKMIEDFSMSYTELAKNTDVLTKNELENIQSGKVIDWMNESRALCKEIYASTEIGDKLSYRYIYDHMNTVRSQLQKGGIRLAVLLNNIFG